ncbi:hypothetical protein FHU41_000455 [Psychromicrobium silvestre]|uniref:Uncharacterized protein n=1 Tax=Psychromicrobium silvestre TaxID=1645614 RepID=A0A7Y9S462_9MICC|nr:hypothetical protein [Psychromicrobium silvestre]NYE94234.1 hypothetical protein [Psychromicrobium silvestre]
MLLHQYSPILERLGDDALIGQAADFELSEHEVKSIVRILPSDVSLKSTLSNCPVPGRYFSRFDDGSPEGEVIVFVRDGMLNFIVYSWYRDEMPADWPLPVRLLFEDS